MEYEGKGGRNDYDFGGSNKKTRVSNKRFYLMCGPCNHHGDTNEILCAKCGERMYLKSGMLRADKNGNIKF